MSYRGIQCPRCSCYEIGDRGFLNIRVHKVFVNSQNDWAAECLQCKKEYGDGWFDGSTWEKMGVLSAMSVDQFEEFLENGENISDFPDWMVMEEIDWKTRPEQ